MSGVAVNDGCVDLYNQIKMKKDHRFRWQEACMDARVKNEIFSFVDSEDFVAKLPEGEPRYALVDYEYTSEDGRPQSKLCFVFWLLTTCLPRTTVKDRMVYASSKDALKKKFPGIMKEVQANDMGDLDVKEVDDLMKKK
eukprot:s935_g18.t1